MINIRVVLLNMKSKSTKLYQSMATNKINSFNGSRKGEKEINYGREKINTIRIKSTKIFLFVSNNISLNIMK